MTLLGFMWGWMVASLIWFGAAPKGWAPWIGLGVALAGGTLAAWWGHGYERRRRRDGF